MAAPAQQHRRRHFSLLSRRRIIVLLVLLLGLYLLLPEVGSFNDSLGRWHQLEAGWLLVALATFSATYGLAAGLYKLLALKPLSYSRTVGIQIASMFANRLLPAGIGAIGINYEYLRRHKHNQAQASAVIALNNGLGFGGHMLLLAGVIVAAGGAVKVTAKLAVPISDVYWALAIAGLIGTSLSLWPRLRTRLVRTLRQTTAILIGYRHRPVAVVAALGCAMALTSLYAVSLYACSRALGLDISLAKIFIVMTLGVIGATAVPTPGGLGGAEAGLVGGLVLYGLSSSDALAVALLYRLLTYWLALVAGAGALVWIERRGYI